MICAASLPRPFRITRRGFYEPCLPSQQYRLHLLLLRRTHDLPGMRSSLFLLPAASCPGYHDQDLLFADQQRNRDTESLQVLLRLLLLLQLPSAAFFDCDGCTYSVSPASVLKTDGLDFLYLIVNIQASIFGDFFSFFDGSNSIAI